jgi:DnaK suppressor protein
MYQSELKQFQETIERLIAELERPLYAREEIVLETSADTLDEIVNATNRNLAAQQLELRSSRLRELKSALRRLETGVYGICLECESEIGLKRLKAVPWARYCIVCQELADRSWSKGDTGWAPEAELSHR